MSNIYFSDQPVSTKNNDMFSRYGFSRRIAQTIMNRSDSSGITIGIYGQWGEGKTSVLNFIQEELKKDESILILNFNLWRYTDEEALLESFLEKVAKLIDYELKTKTEKFAEFMKKYGAIGSLIGYDASSVGKLVPEAKIEILKERVNEALRDGNNKLVIIIDDIDRLDKNEIFSLFRLVKLTANFEKTTYILSFDEKMVSNAIGERFGENRESGSNFLEKIIQVPLKIPQAQKNSLYDYFIKLLDKVIDDNKIRINENQAIDFTTEFNENVLLRLQTPRLAARYCNVLSFSLPLLEGEVNIIDLMLIEAVKIFYPEHYEFIKNNPLLFLTSYSTGYGSNKNDVEQRKKELIEKLNNLEKGFTNKEKEAIKNLLERLFPRLTEALYNTFLEQGAKEWTKEKRIGSAQYFKRYFSYSILDDEISDIEFEEILSLVRNADHENSNEFLGNYIIKIGLNEFIYKINLYDDELNWKTTKKIITALVQKANTFSNITDSQNFGISTEVNQAAFFIHHLFKIHSSEQDIFEFFKSLLLLSPISFAFTLEYWIRSGKKEDDRLFNENQHNELAKILREIVLAQSSELHPIYKVTEDNLNFIIITWHKENPQEVKEYFSSVFNQNPNNIKDFLIAFVPTIHSIILNKSFKTDLEKKNFNLLKEALDIDLMYNIIKINHSQHLEDEEVKFYNSKEGQSEMNILRQFIYWYEIDERN